MPDMVPTLEAMDAELYARYPVAFIEPPDSAAGFQGSSQNILTALATCGVAAVSEPTKQAPAYSDPITARRVRVADDGSIIGLWPADAQPSRGELDHNQASFAFLLAREVAETEYPDIDLRVSRKLLAADPRFAELFTDARTRVGSMTLRFVAIDDPELRTLFEVYAAVALGTRYNSFDTH